MPIADDNPRRATRYWLTVHHPLGGALKYDLESLDPDDPAAVAAIAVDLKARGLHWPPPREFAEANLRRFRAAELAAVSVTVRELQPVDNRARPLGGAYRLAWDEAKRVQRLEDPRSALLGVVQGKGWEGADYGLCWAERLVERDLRRSWPS